MINIGIDVHKRMCVTAIKGDALESRSRRSSAAGRTG